MFKFKAKFKFKNKKLNQFTATLTMFRKVKKKNQKIKKQWSRGKSTKRHNQCKKS